MEPLRHSLLKERNESYRNGPIPLLSSDIEINNRLLNRLKED